MEGLSGTNEPGASLSPAGPDDRTEQRRRESFSRDGAGVD